MTDTPPIRRAEPASAVGEVIGTTLLAFALSFFTARLALTLDMAPRFILVTNLSVFFLVVHLDPIGMLRARPSLREMAAKVSVGLILGVFVMLIYPRVGGEIAGEAVASGGTGSGLAVLKTLGPLMILMPLLFLTPFLERLVKGQRAARPVTVEEAKISAAFPVFVTVHMGLMLAVPAAMWLADLPALWALGTAMLGVGLAVIDTRLAPKDDLIDDLEEAGWGPRPDSAAEAWSGLRKGLRALVSSALFVGATIYLSILATMPFLMNFDLFEVAPSTAIGSIAIGGILVVGIFLALSVLAALAMSGAAHALSRWQGGDPLTANDLARHASARLFGGGMHFVRPDLDDD